MNSKTDYYGMKLVSERYETIAGINADKRITTMLDMEVVQENFGLINWAKVATMAESDFIHDLFGIKFHINRQTRLIENCFVPRFVGNF